MNEVRKMKWTRANLIKWIVTVFLPLTFLAIPVNTVYTTQMRSFFVITVFSLCIIAFELVDLMIIAALMPALWIAFKVAPAATAFSAWSSTTPYMCMGAFMLAAILEDCGLLKRISYWIMTKTGDNYLMLLLGVFAAGLVLSILTFGSAYIVMGALCYGLCRSLNILGTKMAAAVGMTCMIATSAVKSFTYCATIYGIVGGMAAQIIPGFQVTFLQSMLHNWPMGIVCLLTVIVIAKWYKADRPLNGKAYFKKELVALGPMSRNEKINVAILGIIIAFLLSNPWHHLDVAYGFMIFPWLAFIPMIGSATRETLKKLNWEMVFFIAACMGIGNVAGSLGFSTIITDYCLPLFERTGSPYGIFSIVFGLVFVFNFLMTPVAIWTLVTQPIIQIALSLNMNPLPFVYALVQSSEAIILPYEYVSYLAIYAFGMIGMKDFIQMSLVRCLIYFAGFLLLLIPYWNLIGLL